MINKQQMRNEHENDCQKFRYMVRSFGIDKSSTFRAPYSKYSGYHLIAGQTPGGNEFKDWSRIIAIKYCPFCGIKLDTYDDEK